jgi:hypothetical protein
MKKIKISHLQQHDSFKGNKSDAFWYQFCSSKPLEEFSNTKIIEVIETMLNSDKNAQVSDTTTAQ